MAKSDLTLSVRVPDADIASENKVGLFAKKTAERPSGQLFYRGDNEGGDPTAYPIADEEFADGAAAGAVAQHEATYNHLLLHVQGTDQALDTGGPNEISAADLRSHVGPEAVQVPAAGSAALVHADTRRRQHREDRLGRAQRGRDLPRRHPRRQARRPPLLRGGD